MAAQWLAVSLIVPIRGAWVRITVPVPPIRPTASRT